MAWRLAKSLIKLREQINAMYPGRDKASDGSIGDARHRAGASDHNPNRAGVVTAIDIDKDLSAEVKAGSLADALAASRDPRIKYLIWNRRMMSSYPARGYKAWSWRPYTGVNAHKEHLHVSVQADPKLYDSEAAWRLDLAARDEPKPQQQPVIRRGDSGEAVRLLQERLGLKPDGHFGPKTEQALIAFQKAAGLSADGIAGPKSWAAILKER